MVTVYVWDAHYAKGSPGHASAVVTGGQPPGNTYISWWPEKRSLQAITIGVRRGIHARLSDDELSTAEGRKPDHTVPLHGLDETAIKAFWKKWRQYGNYHGLLFNCATTAGRALKEGGGDRYAPAWTSPTVWTPGDVLRYAVAIQRGLSGR